MSKIYDYLRRYRDRLMVRPLALAGPVLILLISLGLLRPLRYPAMASHDETLRLATIQALVEHKSLSLDRAYAKTPGAIQTPTGIYSSQPPMMAILLSAPAWLMTRIGITFHDHHVLMEYLLIVIGVTLPVAGAAGLIYRMGRLFELRRPWRTALGFCVVAASGLLSYAVVLNQYAPAAVLVVASAACLIHVAAMNRDDRRAGWFALAGACGALAATIDPAAVIMFVLFLFVIPAMRFSIARRLTGVFIYILAAIPVFSLHAAWNIPVSGDILPASFHPEFRPRPTPIPVAAIPDEIEFDEPAARTIWDAIGSHALWLLNATFGAHGAFSHFPVLVLGILGIGAVMHRHWPYSTKTLAAATGAGAIAIVVACRVARLEWTSAMFAAKWFIVFSPMLLFWTGAWLRRSHSPFAWSAAGVMLLFSLIIGLLGATGPTRNYGSSDYTAAVAWSALAHPNRNLPDPGALAGRSP